MRNLLNSEFFYAMIQGVRGRGQGKRFGHRGNLVLWIWLTAISSDGPLRVFRRSLKKCGRDFYEKVLVTFMGVFFPRGGGVSLGRDCDVWEVGQRRSTSLSTWMGWVGYGGSIWILGSSG